jgi:hypothetical protein
MIDLMFALILDYRLLTPDYKLCAVVDRTAAVTVEGVSQDAKDRSWDPAAVPSSSFSASCAGGQCVVPSQRIYRWRLFRRR